MANTLVNGAKNIFTLANGDECVENFELAYRFKAGTDARIQSRVATLAYDIMTKFNGVSRGYLSMLPAVSNILAEESWKELDGCKGANQLIISITGCSKATASELIKVAKCFYASGELVEGWGNFSYSELILLADPKLDESREGIRERIIALGSHTRNELKEIIKEERAKALEAKNAEEYGDDAQNVESEEKEAESSAVELEPEVETPTQTGDADDDGDWDNVGDTFKRIDAYMVTIQATLKKLALDKSTSKVNLQEELLNMASQVEEFLNDNYGETQFEFDSADDVNA